MRSKKNTMLSCIGDGESNRATTVHRLNKPVYNGIQYNANCSASEHSYTGSRENRPVEGKSDSGCPIELENTAGGLSNMADILRSCTKLSPNE